MLLAKFTHELSGKGEALPWKLQIILQGRFLDFSSQTTNAMGNAQIWIPKGASEEQRAKLTKAFSDISNIAAKMAETPADQIEGIRSLFGQLEKNRERAKTLLSDGKIENLDPDFTDIRLKDHQAMLPSIKSNISLLNHLEEKNYQAFITQLQKELNAETADAVFGLSGELSSLSGVSEKGDEAIEELSQIMEIDLLSTQKKVVDHLQGPGLKNAIPHQQKAAELLKKGVKLLDFAVVEFVKAKNKLELPSPPEGAEPVKDPSEEQIEEALRKALAALEKEARQSDEKKMGLGLGTTRNLKMKQDWEKTSEKKKKEMEKKRRQMQQASAKQKQQAKKAQRAAAKAQQMASQKGQNIAERLNKQVAVPWKNRQTQSFDGQVTWNKLASELRQSLTQDIESDIPEEYREAIQQYFREVAEANKEQ